MTTNLETLNKMNEDSFTSTLGDVFEHSPWIARQVHKCQPFKNVAELHKSMVDIVKNAPMTKQTALLCAHPELAGREAKGGELTSSSSEEQSSAGLDALTSEEMEIVSELNTDYRGKFGFPFIIAVRNHTKESIFSEWRRRLTHDEYTELQTCLEQVYLIGRIRLELLIE